MIFLLLRVNWYQCYFPLALLIWAGTGYAYHLNSKLPVDDPKKKDFSPVAVFLAPFTLPFIILGMISLFIIKAILYSIFLVLFTIALIAKRKPFILVWLDKIARKVGNILLEINTSLIRLYFNPRIGNPQPL
jgi:hypothetical protein